MYPRTTVPDTDHMCFGVCTGPGRQNQPKEVIYLQDASSVRPSTYRWPIDWPTYRSGQDSIVLSALL
jgi:hypothetical protein